MISNEVLKNKILDDAMHGLLVKNSTKNSIDELNEIITTNKNKSNKKDLSTFSLENPHSIPDNWNWVELGKIVEINLGFTHTPKYVSDGVKFLSVKDISSGYIDFNNVKYVSEEEYNTAPYGAKPHKGDILFGRVGTIGVPQIIETDDKFCIFVSLGFLRDFSNKLNKKFICYWMYSNTFKNQVYHVVKGAAQINLNTKWLQSFLIPFPPLEEQEEIVKKVDELFELIDRKEKNDIEKEKLKEVLKEKIIDSAIHGTLVENDVTLESVDCDKSTNVIPFEIPNNWKWISIKDISYSVYDGSHNPPKDSGVGIPILSALNIHDNKININEANRFVTLEDYAKEDKKINYQKGDVLLTIVGTVGRTAIIDFDDKFCLQRSVSIIKPKEFIYSKYLMYFLESKHCLDIYKEEAKGTAQAGFYLKKLKELSVSVPPLEEQKRIVEKIASLFELIEQL